ncbi:MAG: DUF2062 domain-containing protein [Proteobacteria bacterium]|nr:DUF2062 domain-containing protein [Pseudomonadota bacterium]
MPRKYFRKYLPSHASIRDHRWLGRFGGYLHHPNLWHLNRHSVAGGVALGLFAGLVPGPLQMLTALLLAVALHVNLPVALLTTLYTNPFTIVPLYLLAYAYGSLLLGGNGPPAAVKAFEMDWLHLGDSLLALMHWTLALGPPLGVGLVALAITLAGIGYFAVQAAWRAHVMLAWRARSKRRRRETQK